MIEWGEKMPLLITPSIVHKEKIMTRGPAGLERGVQPVPLARQSFLIMLGLTADRGEWRSG